MTLENIEILTLAVGGELVRRMWIGDTGNVLKLIDRDNDITEKEPDAHIVDRRVTPEATFPSTEDRDIQSVPTPELAPIRQHRVFCDKAAAAIKRVTLVEPEVATFADSVRIERKMLA